MTIHMKRSTMEKRPTNNQYGHNGYYGRWNIDDEDDDSDDERKRAVTSVNQDTGIDDDDDGEEPNYKCVVCDETQYIDDHKTVAPAYCRPCEKVRDHTRIEDD